MRHHPKFSGSSLFATERLEERTFLSAASAPFPLKIPTGTYSCAWNMHVPMPFGLAPTVMKSWCMLRITKERVVNGVWRMWGFLDTGFGTGSFALHGYATSKSSFKLVFSSGTPGMGISESISASVSGKTILGRATVYSSATGAVSGLFGGTKIR